MAGISASQGARLHLLMNALAEDVAQLSDDAIIKEAGDDLEATANKTRKLLLSVLATPQSGASGSGQ